MSTNVDLKSVPAYLVYRQKASGNEVKKKKKRKRHEKNITSTKKQKLTSTDPDDVKTKAHTKTDSIKYNVDKKKRNKRHLQEEKNVHFKKAIQNNIEHNRQQKPVDNKQFQQSHFQNGMSEELKKYIQSDNPLLDAVQLLSWFIYPVVPEIFFKTYWEQKVLHIKRSNKNYYTHIFNSCELDRILRNNELYYTQNVDVVSYEKGVKEVFNQEGRATPSALWDYYSNGCSIRILNPQTYTHKVHLLLATFQEYYGAMVGANVYLTPPNSQGFAPHYDDIEAFIVQLEGRKHWKLYQPKGADVLARFSSPNLKCKDIGNPFIELTLNAGEMLYFPRGTIHEGCTDANSHSLHITISVYQQTSFADLLHKILPNALNKAAENDIEFRKGLPLNFLKHFGLAADFQNNDLQKLVQTKVENLIHTLVNYIDIDTSADMLGRKLMHDSMPPILSKDEAKRSWKADGPYLNNGKVLNKIEIRLDSRIRLLRYYCVRLLIEDNSNPKLYYTTENATVYHGKEEQWLELELSMIPTIRLLQSTYPRYIEVKKLPMEEETLKLQLIADLWEHGLIVSEQPLHTTEDE